jgi:NADPH oxidase
MAESGVYAWFQKEFTVPRRLAFNVIFYGIQLGLFAYGWYSQVSFDHNYRN